MGLPHVTSFCCCMGLEMGSKFIGFVHLVVSISMMIMCSVFAENVRANIGTVEDAGDQLYSRWYKVAVVAAALTAVHVLLALTLLYSTFKRATLGLKVWVYGMSILCAASLLFILVQLCVGGLSDGNVFLNILEGVLFFSAVSYCILCVYSYYLMLRSAEDMEGPHKTVY